MRITSNALSQEECVRIHKDSIRILEEIGVKVPNEEVLSMLQQAGAKIDWDAQIANISGDMVEEALKQAPKEFTLESRNPKFDLHMGPDGCRYNGIKGPFINMDGCGSYTIDFRTGKRRLSTLQDLTDAGKIFDTIPEAHILWSSIMPKDVTEAAAGVVSSATSMLASGKHLMDEIQKPEEWPYILELCKAFAGNEKAVTDRKIYGACYCTVAPLCHDAEMLEGTILLARAMGPILAYPMPCNGTTGPASLYSNIALSNAEALSTYVVFQTVSPGCPIIYGAALGRMNVRTGFFAEGAVETGLQMAAITDMGKYYGLPTMCAGCLSDANEIGEQAMMEKMFTTLPLLQSGCDIVQGLGLIESSMTLSLEQMLVDAEMFRQAKRMVAGVDVCDEKDLFEDIKNIGPGGDFLRSKSTRKAFRTDEFYNPQLVPWQAHDRWERDGAKGMYLMAHDEVEKILAADPISPVDDNTRKLVEEIIEEAKAKL